MINGGHVSFPLVFFPIVSLAVGLWKHPFPGVRSSIRTQQVDTYRSSIESGLILKHPLPGTSRTESSSFRRLTKNMGILVTPMVAVLLSTEIKDTLSISLTTEL